MHRLWHKAEAEGGDCCVFCSYAQCRVRQFRQYAPENRVLPPALHNRAMRNAPILTSRPVRRIPRGTASVSKTCLVRFDNNKYSVAASAVGRPVEVTPMRPYYNPPGRTDSYEHPRSFGHGETIYDPWHYVPVLARQPGALRNGAPFKDWVLPAAIERVQSRAAGSSNDPSPGSTANVVLQKTSSNDCRRRSVAHDRQRQVALAQTRQSMIRSRYIMSRL